MTATLTQTRSTRPTDRSHAGPTALTGAAGRTRPHGIPRRWPRRRTRRRDARRPARPRPARRDPRAAVAGCSRSSARTALRVGRRRRRSSS